MNQSDIIDRIETAVKLDGSSTNSFARLAGIDPGNLAKMLGGKQKITDKTLIKISDSHNINFKWLKFGEGEMLNNANSSMKSAETTPALTTRKTTRASIPAPKTDRYTFVPLLNIDSVGGFHSENLTEIYEEFTEEWIQMPGAMEGDCCIHESGHSMEPMIPDGAIMLLRRVPDWRRYFGFGHPYVLVLEDGRRITKIVRKSQVDPGENVLCVSVNPDYEPEELAMSEIAVVWQVMRIRIDKNC